MVEAYKKYIYGRVRSAEIPKSIKSKSVIVIGGGAAGLAAASRLNKFGVKNVTVFEASNRLGGRIHR